MLTRRKARKNSRTNAPTKRFRPGFPRRRRGGLTWGVGRFIALVAFTVVMTGAGIYQVYSHYQVVKLGYVLDQDLFDYRRRMERHKRLKLSIASYKHPTSVGVFAVDELGMRPPGPRDELTVPNPAHAVPQLLPEPDLVPEDDEEVP